jgi:hypothetical protein
VVGLFGSIKGHEYVCFADSETGAVALAKALLENRLSVSEDTRWARSHNPFARNYLGKLAGKDQQGQRVEARVSKVAA